ncbi:sarcosine oxidase subunit gamma [Ruegeria sp. 2205SS24-7]|uniref:sarcosine oxidase subunit gamma n=1 Tax=Ruegeria discodermiae TaxID=3064389 RepID=UPI002741D0F3|nr:sarcosine oxidase subunit gamma [Ruegeria sp. 2205SS24-7]MDP5219056.1 sarcosine oxidase subunit gamma [Ruegeria sp. 2205SS24-7]
MHDLVAITALGGSEPRVDTTGTVTCSEVPGVALASVAARLGREKKAAKALAKLIGTPAPAIGRFEGAPVAAFWTGPDQWMVEAPFDSHEDLAEQAKAALGDTASVSEQTDAWVRFDLSGADVLAVLELLCPLDARKMEEGDAAGTPIHHLGCFVLCRAPEAFSIYGPRSSAGSLNHAILAAMTSAL